MKLHKNDDGTFEVVEWGESGCVASCVVWERPEPIPAGPYYDGEGNFKGIITEEEAAQEEAPTWITYFCTGDALHEGKHTDDKGREFEDGAEGIDTDVPPPPED